jgi:hypothetical protein
MAPTATYQLTRAIPVEDGYDLVVAGGGPAGADAAICAGRLSARVLGRAPQLYVIALRRESPPGIYTLIPRLPL